MFRTSFDSAVSEESGLVAIDKASNEIIGFSCFATRYVEPGEIEIGWTFLARNHWDGACNRDMKRIMLAHALKIWPVVVFRIGAENWRSRKAMEKIGGVLLDRTQMVEFMGQELLHVCYAISSIEL